MFMKDDKNISNKTTTPDLPIKRRGRKPKKDLDKQNKNEQDDNIMVSFEENTDSNVNTDEIKINNILTFNDDIEQNTEIENVIESNNIFLQKDNSLNLKQEPTIKKRGRKPKGGKIIQQITPFNNVKESKPNIILHLKCSLNDLNSSLHFNSNIQSFNFSSNKNEGSYEILTNNDFLNNFNSNTNNSDTRSSNNNVNLSNTANDNNNAAYDYDDDENVKCKENDIKEIWKKLKQLEHNLHINNVSGKKSACFWCTYEFDNPPIYIPKYFMKDTYNVYGCFCSPECSTAYLMNENIDTSIKFERYHLLNHIYSKIYDYNKNIKPAPSPYYVLDKYYGNLSIQEYRALLKNDRLFLVVDKPLTRILPELHEDNDDFIINNKIIPSNSYQINKKLQKKQQNKSSILNENFGLQ